MFIMRKNDFNDYCTFVFNILNDYLSYHNLKTIDDVYNFINEKKEDYLKPFYPNNTIKYQSRIGGALSERLLNIWVEMKNLKVKTFNVIQTETKYNQIKKTDFL
jgi:hypothetical protein